MSFSKRLLSSAPAAFVASENFKVITYTGTGGSQSITGVGFKPDWIWIKNRNDTNGHILQDSTRGVGNTLFSHLSSQQSGNSGDLITSFDTDGFTVNENFSGSTTNESTNKSGNTYVAWCWKANGGTTSSNTDGSITSTVQTNTDAGFSIIKYTGNGSSGATIGHGLGVVPDMFIVKRYSGSGTWNWRVYHKDTDSTNPQNYNIALNGSSGRFDRTEWNDTAPTSTVFSVDNHGSVNENGINYICYAFADIASFSKFGGYTGNGSDDGPIVETGFEPAFLMIRRSDGTGNWQIWDNKRSTTNTRNKLLFPNDSAAEQTLAYVDFLSNGFQVVDASSATGSTNVNINNANYIYMAFAADPDEEAPTLASSFNAIPYAGSGDDPLAINKVGFKPGLVWIKSRDVARESILSDIVRGIDKEISTSDTAAEESRGVSSFDADGFTLDNSTSNYNDDGEDYMLWTWKADDNEPTIFSPSQTVADIKSTNLTLNLNLAGGSYSGGGSAIEDLSSAEEDFTVTNATVPSGFGGYYIDFDGSGDYADSDSSIATTSGNDITIEFWIRPESASQTSYAMIIDANHSTAVSGSTGQGWCIQQTGSTSNSFYFVYYDGSGYQSNSDAQLFTLTNGVWSHIAIVKNGTSVQVYKDGSAGTSWTAGNANLANPNQKIRLGGWLAGGRDFNGNIAQVRLYSDALSSSEVTANYNATKGLFTTTQSIVSANANAGFSIVKWEGTGTQTEISHGLSAAPEMIISKRLDSTNNWSVYHKDIGLSHTTYPNWLYLNLTSSKQNSVSSANHPYYAAPSSTVIYQNTGTSESTNVSGGDYISYCFHSVSGYSKIGSYAGNGSTNAITTGFKPDFVMIKTYDNTDQWVILDSIRGGSNYLQPNLAATEGTESGVNVSFTSTGFTHTGSGGGIGQVNSSGSNYIYWAVAKNVPQTNVLADSFGVVKYIGNGGVQSVRGFSFNPDFLWVKRTSNTENHSLYDSVRGVQKEITSDKDSPNSETTKTNGISSFNSDGFTVAENNANNTNNESYVAWGWKAGGTWVSNLDGTNKSAIVNANTANGFSIIKYTGTSASSQSVGHGLTSTPEFVMIKKLSGTEGWIVWYPGASTTNYLVLNTNAATATGATWGGTHSSTVVNLQDGPSARSSGNGEDYIAYVWHSVSGFSKIGTYTGNGSTQSITGLGFAPDYVMIKEVSASESWRVFDNLRGATKRLFPDTNGAESAASDSLTSFDSAGFSLGSSAGVNQSGQTYVYMAYKQNATLSTEKANSFNITTYTGNATDNRSITGVGFRPDLVWIKQTSGTQVPIWYDSVRGPGNYIYSSASDAQGFSAGTVKSFNSDGFSVGTSNSENQNSQTFVAWSWKAGNNWVNNNDGNVSSIVNYNTGNKFSIVRWTGTGSSTTVGHGMGTTPTFIIGKTLDSSAKWRVYHSGLSSAANYLNLNDTFGAGSSSNVWNSTAPTSSVFSVGSDLSPSGEDMIAYVWADCDGLSKFGTYTGNGSASGTVVEPGFSPDFIIVRRTDGTSDWGVFDSQRSGTYYQKGLKANTSDAEFAETNINSFCEFLAVGHGDAANGGFRFRDSGSQYNVSSASYIYVAFKIN